MRRWLAAAIFASRVLTIGSAQAPVSRFTGLDNAPHTLAELRGHPGVVNFWATWCGPCRAEMPRLQKLS